MKENYLQQQQVEELAVPEDGGRLKRFHLHQRHPSRKTLSMSSSFPAVPFPLPRLESQPHLESPSHIRLEAPRRQRRKVQARPDQRNHAAAIAPSRPVSHIQMAGTSPAPAPAPAAPGIQGEDGAGTGCDVVVDPAIPPCPGGLFNFPPGSVLVEDADEEVSEGVGVGVGLSIGMSV